MIGEVLGQTFSVVFANIIPFGSLAMLVTDSALKGIRRPIPKGSIARPFA
jgi:hypothetical protein